MDSPPPPAASLSGSEPETRGLALRAPATRREVLLFGLLILALTWLITAREPTIVHVLPDEPARAGRLA
jgi:hypothetical protein